MRLRADQVGSVRLIEVRTAVGVRVPKKLRPLERSISDIMHTVSFIESVQDFRNNPATIPIP